MEKLVKRGRGRPKGSKNKVKKADKVEAQDINKDASCCDHSANSSVNCDAPTQEDQTEEGEQS